MQLRPIGQVTPSITTDRDTIVLALQGNREPKKAGLKPASNKEKPPQRLKDQPLHPEGTRLRPNG